MSRRMKTPFADKVPGKRPVAPNPRIASVEEMVEKVRLRAWFRQGKHETVQRLRKDKGFARAVVEHAINIVARERAPLFQEAMNSAIRNRPTIEHKLRNKLGVWWDELEPLSPAERSWALKKLREMWDIPHPEEPKRKRVDLVPELVRTIEGAFGAGPIATDAAPEPAIQDKAKYEEPTLQ